jgi:hypothetical protein
MTVVPTQFQLDLSNAVIEFSFFAALLFMIGYTVFAKWWQHQLGWARISLDFGIALALSPTMLNRLFNINPFSNQFGLWYQISAVGFVGCISLWNLWLVGKTQIKAWRNGKEKSSRRNSYQAITQREIDG